MSDVVVSKSRARYAARREAIMAAATEVFAEQGVSGFTLAAVAKRMDLHPVSLTYYFKRKEDLAASCLMDTLRRFGEMVDEAGTKDTAQERLRSFVRIYFEVRRRIALGEASELAPFDEIRLVGGQHQEELMNAFYALNLKIAHLLENPEAPWLSLPRRRLLAWLITEQLCWTTVWLAAYEPDDYARVADRTADIMIHGLAANGQVPPQEPLMALGAPLGPRDEVTRERFLVAATALINAEGYRGASVDKISGCLNVTKGSFYHHNADKEELTLACFERTFDLIDEAKRGADEGSGWRRLWMIAASLAVYQSTGVRGRMLRHYALAAVPPEMRRTMATRLDQIAHAFAGLISDGIADGSLRPVDALLAGRFVMAMFNSARIHGIADPEIVARDTISTFVRPLLLGFFTPVAREPRAA